jgi:hypothetical protein
MVKGSETSLRSVGTAFLCAARRGAIADLTIVLAITAVMTVLVPSRAISAELSRHGEYEIKAVFLLNFIKFTEWPAGELGKTADPFIIGIVGDDPFGSALDKVIEGETYQSKKIVARRFSRMDDVAANSHVLFISASEAKNLPAILALIDGQPVLTVSDLDNFAERGGVISLRKINNKIVFDVNLDAAKQAGLLMNAQLLKLAKIVKPRS